MTREAIHNLSSPKLNGQPNIPTSFNPVLHRGYAFTDPQSLNNDDWEET